MTTTLGLRRLSLSLMAGSATIALGHTALAQQTIDDETTAPVVTSTSGDIEITSDGSITLTSGTALTIDSDNDAIVDGSIVLEDTAEDGSTAADDAIGVLVTGDVNFSYTQSGNITLEDDSPNETLIIGENDDDEVEGDEADAVLAPDFAENRYGFRLDEGSYTGNITFSSSAFISIAGDNSTGIAIDGDLDAATASPAVRIDGDVILQGENSDALRVSGNVTGNVIVNSGAVFSVSGANSSAIVLDGDIDGKFKFGGVASVTGFQDVSPELPLEPDAEDFDADAAAAILARNAAQTALTSGDGISITGNITEGVLIDGVLPTEFQGAYTQFDTNADGEITDADSAALTANSTSSISVVGSGNALRIDGGMDGLTIGEFDTSAFDGARANSMLDDAGENGNTDNNIPDYGDWGLINRGTLNANGLYPGVASEVVSIHNATIEQGIRNDGNMDAQALRAAATGLLFGAGATTPEFLNRGRISASVSGSGGDAVAVDLDAGASLPIFINDGTIGSFAISDDSEAVAFRDSSGTVTDFINRGTISAFITDDTDNDELTARDNGAPVGDAIALDFSANTSGVNIISTVTERADIDLSLVARNSFGAITGDILTGSGNDRITADAGPIVGDIFLGAGNDIIDISMEAVFVGETNFGSGDDQLLVNNATIVSTLDFGSGTGTLILQNDAQFAGDVYSTDSVNVDVLGSSFTLGSGTDLAVGTLNVVSQGDLTSALGFAVSQDGLSMARLNAATANIAADTDLDVVFEGAFGQEEVSGIIISASDFSSLDVDALNASLSADVDEELPILFNQSIRLEGNDLWLDLQRKSATELGLGNGISGALDPVINALTEDQELGRILFNASTTEEFSALFNQVLAGPLDAPLAYARAQNNTVTSLVSHRVDAITSSEDRLQRRFWLQEEGYFINRDPDANSNGFDGGGFVIAGGVDAPIGPIDAVGISVHYASARYDEQLGEDFPFDRTTYGADLYYADRIGNFEVDGRIGYAFSDSTSERIITFEDETRNLYGDWNGTQLTANSRVRYVMKMGDTEVRPFAGFDFVALKEDAYTETGDEALILDVDEREAESLRGNVGIELSRIMKTRQRAYDFSVPGTFRPRLTAAWSQELLTDDYSATYNFANGQEFTLLSEPESGAAIIGADMTYENEYATVHFGGSGTFGEQTEVYTLRVGIGLKW